MTERIAVFVNGDNLYSFQKNAFWVDPQLLLNWVEDTFGRVNDAYYFASLDYENEKQVNFFKKLGTFGYTERCKPAKKFEYETYDDEDEEDVKFGFERANIDTDFCCDLLSTMESYDRAVLVCPSKDFIRPISVVRNRGKAVTIIGVKNYITDETFKIIGNKNLVELRSLESNISRIQGYQRSGSNVSFRKEDRSIHSN